MSELCTHQGSNGLYPCGECGARGWLAPGYVTSGGYVPTEVGALRAEVAALKEQKKQDDYAYHELFELAQKKDRQLAALRALRDRLIAWHKDGFNMTELVATIGMAEKLAAESLTKEA